MGKRRELAPRGERITGLVPGRSQPADQPEPLHVRGHGGEEQRERPLGVDDVIDAAIHVIGVDGQPHPNSGVALTLFDREVLEAAEHGICRQTDRRVSSRDADHEPASSRRLDSMNTQLPPIHDSAVSDRRQRESNLTMLEPVNRRAGGIADEPRPLAHRPIHDCPLCSGWIPREQRKPADLVLPQAHRRCGAEQEATSRTKGAINLAEHPPGSSTCSITEFACTKSKEESGYGSASPNPCRSPVRCPAAPRDDG